MSGVYVIPSDAVVRVDKFSVALVHKYMARMIQGKPTFHSREEAMESTRKYLDQGKKVA